MMVTGRSHSSSARNKPNQQGEQDVEYVDETPSGGGFRLPCRQFRPRAPASALAQTVVIGSEGAIPPLDPHRMTGTPGLRVIDAIYDPLVREDLSVVTDTAPALKGSLAESWTVSDDGLVYRFTLRSGVKFHDGTDFNADAVQANFARIMDRRRRPMTSVPPAT
jgi:ABC-type transport system substrate-binding protein